LPHAFPLWQVVSPNWNKLDCPCELRILHAYRQTYACQHFFFLLLLIFATQSPPPKKPFMFPGNYSFECENPWEATSFTDMLNALDNFLISMLESHYSRCFEPNLLDDALFSSAQISGSTPTTVSSVEDTGMNSPAYLCLA
jgi:hypothetical protein